MALSLQRNAAEDGDQRLVLELVRALVLLLARHQEAGRQKTVLGRRERCQVLTDDGRLLETAPSASSRSVKVTKLANDDRATPSSSEGACLSTSAGSD